MKLFISGRGKFTRKHLTPSVAKVKKTLDASRDGELFETRRLANLTDLNQTTLHRIFHDLPGYSFLISRVEGRLWGKPRTINQLRKELE